MKKIIYFLLIIGFISSCVQPEVGYISDNIHSLQDTISVPRGIFKTSTTPTVEGSTYPMEWEITGVTDKNGNLTNELQEEHEVLLWTKPFDPNTDTTLELAMKKLELANKPSIIMNPVSGQFIFTQASKNVIGDDFDVNVSAKNIKGIRQLNKFTHIKMLPFVPVEFPTTTRCITHLVNPNTGATAITIDYRIENSSDSKIPNVLNGTDRCFSIKKISNEPKFGIKVKMIIADSHGTPISPAKIVFYPSGATYLQNYHDNSINPEVSTDGTTFGLPAPPFPQYSRTYTSGTNRYLMYYLTTNNAYTFDRAAYEAEKGVKPDSFYDPYKDTNGNIICRGYIRWGININDTGTYEIIMKHPYTTKK